MILTWEENLEFSSETVLQIREMCTNRQLLPEACLFIVWICKVVESVRRELSFNLDLGWETVLEFESNRCRYIISTLSFCLELQHFPSSALGRKWLQDMARYEFQNILLVFLSVCLYCLSYFIFVHQLNFCWFKYALQFQFWCCFPQLAFFFYLINC